LRVSAELLEKWTSRLAGQDGKALKQRLQTVVSEPSTNAQLTRDLEQCITAALRPFRKMVGAKELLEKWPQGSTLSLAVEDAAITELYNSASINEDHLIQAPPMHLEEAKEEFTRKRWDLLQEATNAVRTQMAIAKESSLVAQYQGKGVGHAPEYEALVLKDWGGQRPGMLIRVNGRLPNPGKYDGLFAVTRTEIRNTLKKDEVQSSATPAPPNGDRGPGGGGLGTGGGTGDGNGPGSGGGGGGAGGSGGCPKPEPTPWWMWLTMILAGILIVASVHYWGYQRGLRRTAHV
jgi:hypothetical protein